MKKVIVIGCPGGGKSVFSRALARKTGLPLFHLDMMYWNTDRTKVPRETFLGCLDEALHRERWIIDGNYASTMRQRLEACDTVFFLDYPTEVCLAGVEARRGKPRPDMPWIEEEPDEEFLSLIRDYAEKKRPEVLALLGEYADKTVYVFRSSEQADLFLKGGEPDEK